MDTFLVAVPASALGHGTDHQVHAVGRLHEGRVLADAHEIHIRGHFFAVSDLADRRVNSLQIVRDPVEGVERENLLHIAGRAFQNTLDVHLADRSSVEAVRLPDELRQHDGPDEVHRQYVGPVDDGDAGIESVLLRLWGDQMDADGTRTVGIQSCMQDFTECEIHVGLEISSCLSPSEKKRNLCHFILSALQAGPALIRRTVTE